MPPPIVPAPMTPTFLTGSVGVSSGTSAIFQTCRSAKNTWRCAFDCVGRIRSRNACALALHAFVERQFDRVVHGARWPSSRLRSRGICARWPCGSPRKSPGLPRAASTLSSRSRTLPSGSFASMTLAGEGERALAQMAFFHELVDDAPFQRLLGAGMACPRESPRAPPPRPIRRGRRCVPPAPGMSPSLISGRPNFAEGTATR